MSTPFKSLKYCVIAYIALVVGGTLLLVLSYCLPTDAMLANIQESSLQLTQEGDYYMSLADDKRFMYDNYTSAIMLNIAGHSTGNPLRDTLLPPLHTTELEGQGHVFQLAEWLEGYQDEPAEDLANYPIYWHGYLVVLRPLLLFFNINQIRQISLVVVLGMAALLGTRLVRHGTAFSLAVIVSLLALNICVACQSLPFVGSFVMALAGALFITYKGEGDDPMPAIVCLFCTGALTAYVDFLDTPIVSMGIPLLAWLCSEWSKGIPDVRRCVLTAVGLGIAWSLGYVLFWAAKWVLTTLFTERNMLAGAIGEITQFSGESSRMAALVRNLELAFPDWSRPILVVGCIAVSIIAALRWKEIRPCDLWFVLACVIVALIPVIWTLFTAGHSYIHYWFTYRNFVLTPMAMICAWAAILHKQKRVAPKHISCLANGNCNMA